MIGQMLAHVGGLPIEECLPYVAPAAAVWAGALSAVAGRVVRGWRRPEAQGPRPGSDATVLVIRRQETAGSESVRGTPRGTP
ncbi:hypothetical protein DSM104299_02046 [Baekduia alba]|nr:hypothetical protein DSM104299_02046 [Baekduia alba]